MPSPFTPTTPRTLRFMARTRSPTSPTSCVASSMTSNTTSAIHQHSTDNTGFETLSPIDSFSTSSDTVVTAKPVTINLLELIHANYGGSRHAGDGGQMVFNIEVVDGAPIEMVVPPKTGVETSIAPPAGCEGCGKHQCAGRRFGDVSI